MSLHAGDSDDLAQHAGHDVFQNVLTTSWTIGTRSFSPRANAFANWIARVVLILPGSGGSFWSTTHSTTTGPGCASASRVAPDSILAPPALPLAALTNLGRRCGTRTAAWSNMVRGQITRLVPDRRFGFISSKDQEYFFHASALQCARFEELAEGLPVVCQPSADAEGDRRDEGPRAVSVRLADEAEPGVDNEPLPRGKAG